MSSRSIAFLPGKRVVAAQLHVVSCTNTAFLQNCVTHSQCKNGWVAIHMQSYILYIRTYVGTYIHSYTHTVAAILKNSRVPPLTPSTDSSTLSVGTVSLSGHVSGGGTGLLT